jgi:hypothetical protein
MRTKGLTGTIYSRKAVNLMLSCGYAQELTVACLEFVWWIRSRETGAENRF